MSCEINFWEILYWTRINLNVYLQVTSYTYCSKGLKLRHARLNYIAKHVRVRVWARVLTCAYQSPWPSNGWANSVPLPLETIRHVKLSMLSFTRMNAALLSMKGTNDVRHMAVLQHINIGLFCAQKFTQYPHHHAFPRSHTRTHARTHACTHARRKRTHAHTHTHTHTHTDDARMQACTIQRAHYCTRVGSTSARTHAHSRARHDKQTSLHPENRKHQSRCS